MKKSIFLLLLSILTSTVVFSQQPKYLTGTITKNQQVEVSDISNVDAFYSEKDRFIGKKGHPGSDMTSGSDGYYTGKVMFDDGTSNYFYKIRFVEPANSVTSQTAKVSSAIPQQPKYLTGTITKNQQVEVSDISNVDAFYSEKDRFIGKKGHPESDMTSGSDGYYSGLVKFDDGTSNYFYKIRFVDPANSVTSQTTKVSSAIPPAPSNSNSGTKATHDFDPYLDWDSADNDSDLSEGDRVIVTAINPDDEKYKNRDLYIGKKGTLKSDVEFYEDFFEEYYLGTIKFDNGREAYFDMVKLKDASKKSK